MRVFKSAWFVKFAGKADIADASPKGVRKNARHLTGYAMRSSGLRKASLTPILAGASSSSGLRGRAPAGPAVFAQ